MRQATDVGTVVLPGGTGTRRTLRVAAEAVGMSSVQRYGSYVVVPKDAVQRTRRTMVGQFVETLVLIPADQELVEFPSFVEQEEPESGMVRLGWVMRTVPRKRARMGFEDRSVS